MADIILNTTDKISCPSCSAMNTLAEALGQKRLDELEQDFLERQNNTRVKLTEEIEKRARATIADEYELRCNKLYQSLSEQKQLATEMTAVYEAEKKKAITDALSRSAVELEATKNAEASARSQLEAFREEELKLRAENNALNEKLANAGLEAQREFQTKLSEKEAVGNQKIAELNKKLDDLAKLNADLTRKLESGSQQHTGEAFELNVEDNLRRWWPQDNIICIKSGQRGADLVICPTTPSGKKAGKIVVECKYTQHFAESFVLKAKEDTMREAPPVGISVTLIVARNFPKDFDQPFGEYKGLWLAKPENYIGVVAALRQVILQSYKSQMVAEASQNKSITDAVYGYICSEGFSGKVAAIVDTVDLMRVDLDKERNAFERVWARRSKQIEAITANIMGLVGDLQGIDGETSNLLSEVGKLESFDSV